MFFKKYETNFIIIKVTSIYKYVYNFFNNFFEERKHYFLFKLICNVLRNLGNFYNFIEKKFKKLIKYICDFFINIFNRIKNLLNKIFKNNNFKNRNTKIFKKINIYRNINTSENINTFENKNQFLNKPNNIIYNNNIIYSILRKQRFFTKNKFSRTRQYCKNIVLIGLLINLIFFFLSNTIFYGIVINIFKLKAFILILLNIIVLLILYKYFK